ncbi:MAG: hypothetical protein PG977_000114 [Bartonella clarridgeiae]|uniref:BID domain-containing T4SS effector n=1 Tax=Bartonella clarridgeiae TaxID=56426 RepID=UPI0023F21FB8|nr:BID domain-containing T4SS effector [Bartonella clarridgeiae]WCR54721.1 MAG: hypothetical protein PG977_000114 [Bartonella clarridgeiae]
MKQHARSTESLSQEVEYTEVHFNNTKTNGIQKDPLREQEVEYAEIRLNNNNPNKIQSRNSANIFISPQKIVPLSYNEFIRKVVSDHSIQEQEKETRRLSQIVFGNQNQLANQLSQIHENPSFTKIISNTLTNSPESFAKLAGSKTFGIKNSKRKQAEKNISKLVEAIHKYADAVENSMGNIIKNHNAEQKRLAQSVELPSDSLQSLLDLPSKMRENILKQQNNTQLRKECTNFLNKINSRLSQDELIMLKNNEYELLAKNMNISEEKAQKIIGVVKEVQNLQKELNQIRLSPSNTMAIAR